MTRTREEIRFGRIYTFAAFLSFLCPVCSFAVPLLLPSRLPSVLTMPIVFAFMGAGWLIQALVCRISNFERRGDDGVYESNTKFFNVGRAALPIVIAVAVGFLLISPIDAGLRAAADSAGEIYYTDGNLLPYVYGCLAAALMICGSVLWFFPYQRFTVIRYPMIGLPFMLAAFILNAIAPAPLFTVSVCMFLYIVITMVLINQGNITRQYRCVESVSFMSAKARVYNMALTSTLLVFLAAAALLLFGALNGLAVLIRAILVLITNIPDSDRETPVEEGATQAVGIIFGKTGAEKAINEVSLVFIVAIFAATMIFVIFRQSEWLRSVIASVKGFIASFAEFLSALFERRRRPAVVEPGFYSYRDEERQRQSFRDRNRKNVRIAPAGSFEDFKKRLDSVNGNGEKLIYAYSTLVACLLRAGRGIRRSDTPRQIAAKLSRERDNEGIEGITEAFETVAYAESDPGDEKTGRALSTLCRLVRRNMD